MPETRRPLRTAFGVVLLLAAGVLAIGTLRTPRRSPSPAEEFSTPTTTAPEAVTAPRSAQVWPPPATAEPPTVEADGHRFSVGQPGDVAVIGDWSCDGATTAAVLRPSTGDLSVFDAWPADGADEVPARHISTTPGARSIRVGDDCGHATLVLGDRSTRDIVTISTTPGDAGAGAVSDAAGGGNAEGGGDDTATQGAGE